MSATRGDALLDVRDLSVTFATEAGPVKAVDRVSFTVRRGEVLSLVGESGSGKSVTVQSLTGLLVDPNVACSGQVLYKGRDLLALSPRELREVRGAEIAMIFQDPMTALNPVYRVGWQIEEQLRAHAPVARAAARRRAVELLGAVGIPNAERRADDYPHEFSGGMRQRVMIAMALANDPDLLIADEPTTALDVTIQAQILDLVKRLRSELGSAVLIITHDMGVVADVADRVAVMYAGRIVEQGSKREVFYDPQHPYTWGLLGSIPRLDRPKPARLATIEGQPPSLLDPAPTCSFRSRCLHAVERCAVEPQELRARLGTEHLDACLLAPADKRARRTAAVELGEPMPS